MRVTPFAVAIALAVLAPLTTSAQDQNNPPQGVRIGLNYAAGGKPGIIILPIERTGGDSIGTILARDLDYSDRMNVIILDAATVKALTPGANRKINYALMAKFRASVLVMGVPSAAGVQITVYDVSAKKKIGSADFVLPKGERDGNWRFAVHGISDEIERWILGVRGMAQSRIAFVQSGAIKVVDSDGAMTRTIRAGSGSLSPSWSFDGTRLVYCVLGDNGTQIFEADLKTGAISRISAVRPGLNITPVFTADGNAIVYSRGANEGSDLVMVDRSGYTQRLTVGNGTDNNSPSFSPDGSQIAFISGRSGIPNVYIMDADGTNMTLLTGVDMAVPNYRSSPDWSPDGRSIAYQQRASGGFQVWMSDVRSRVPRQLTTDGENEDPSWAPDARHLVITSTRGGDKQLWVLDTESGRFRQLTHSSGARLASWSPLLGRHAPLIAAPAKR
jgi:TolB protein